MVPRIDLDLEIDINRALSWRRPSALLAIRAVHRARAGDAEGALSDAFAAVAIGARIEAGTGAALFAAMTGAAAKTMGLHALGRVLSEIELDAARSRDLTNRLSTLRVDPEGWRRVWAFQYQESLKLIARMDESDGEHESWAMRLVPQRYVFKPNATRAIFAEAFRTLGEHGRMPCSDVRWPAGPPGGGDRLDLLLGPNGVGRIFSWIALPTFTEFTLRRCELDDRVEAARAWVALRAHLIERGELPQRLEDLAPIYLAQVPSDAFDGATLRYDRERRLLWSIGSDFEDDGGRGEADQEPVFPIPF